MASGHSFAESSILKMRNFAPEGIRHPILRYGGHIKNDGPRCMKHRGALCLRLGERFIFVLRRDVWTSAVQFQDPLALGLHASGLDTISNCRRCESSGCLAVIDL